MSYEKPKTIDPELASTLLHVLDALDGYGISASGVAHATGTVQLTLKPEHPARTTSLADALGIWADGLFKETPNAHHKYCSEALANAAATLAPIHIRMRRDLIEFVTDQLRDFIERMIGYYLADQERSDSRFDRRDSQIIALAEVLRFMDGDTRTSEQVADYVPVGLADLPRRFGATATP